MSGHSYAFFALSADSVGNLESIPPAAVEPSVVVATEAREQPLRFALHPAFPNPFNPSTRISFDLEQAGRVTVRLYNVLGQRLEVFDLGQMNSGRFSQMIDFSRYARGVYFYELRVSGSEGTLFQAIERAVLVR